MLSAKNKTEKPDFDAINSASLMLWTRSLPCQLSFEVLSAVIDHAAAESSERGGGR